jgi:hypothetical protein
MLLPKGTVVTIRSDLILSHRYRMGDGQFSVLINPSMLEYGGCRARIVGYYTTLVGCLCYILCIDHQCHIWTDEMFEN